MTLRGKVKPRARAGRVMARALLALCLSASLAGTAPGAATDPGSWLAPGNDAGGTYFSPLTHVNATSVVALGFAWDYSLDTTRGLEATPLVVDGTMYTSGDWGRVYALDAATGTELWTFLPPIDGQWGRYACCDAVNRGVAVWKGSVYVGTTDGWLYALDAKTGHPRWKADTLLGRDRHLPYTSSGAPLIAGDVVVLGNSGGDFDGVRGYVTAYDLRTGAERWRFFTVPRDPRIGPQDQPHLAAAVKTWDPDHRWAAGGGGTVWDGMAYDPARRLIYIGTGNGSPYNITAGGRHGGDDLYAASIIAIHADSGAMAWYFQAVPGDRWDYDATQKMILADLTADGRQRRVLMQASKDGFFYVLDRDTGELISAKNYARVNWTGGLDPKTGRPHVNPAVDYNTGPKLIAPSMAGAHSWQPMAFNPRTGLVYIPVIDTPMIFIDTAHRPVGFVEGNFTVLGVFPPDYDPAAMRGAFGPLPPIDKLPGAHDLTPAPRAILLAWDPVRQRAVWERPFPDNWSAGVLTTAGNLVIQGDPQGVLSVYAADTGRLLKRIELGTSIMAAPMTYAVHGEQYIAVMAGYGGGGMYAPFPPDTAAYKYGNSGRIIALKLGGPDPPLPNAVAELPFPQRGAVKSPPAELHRGELLYTRYCSRCHVFGRGMLPDLRRMSDATRTMFYDIVLRGAYVGKGMGRWDDVLSQADAQAIYDYVNEQAVAAAGADAQP